MKKPSKSFIRNLITYALVIVAFIVCQHLSSAKILSKSLRGQLVPITIWIVMAISLNLTVGVSGELSLGHAGFMSVGAFSGIIVSSWVRAFFMVDNDLLLLVIALVFGGIFAGIAGVLIGVPVLRLRGDYLAIVTLAFGEIIKNIMNCLYFSLGPGSVRMLDDGSGTLVRTIMNDRLHIGFNTLPPSAWTVLINGPAGSKGIPRLATFGAGFALIIVALIVVLNLVNSRSGRAIMAIRDNRIAAEAMGINVTKYKMMAFVTSAALAGMAGALYGLNLASVTPATFDFNTSINVLVFVVLGGIGNIPGSIISATLLTVLPEVLRAFSSYRMLAYAVVLILVMLATNNPMLRTFFARFRPKHDGENGKEGKTA